MKDKHYMIKDCLVFVLGKGFLYHIGSSCTMFTASAKRRHLFLYFFGYVTFVTAYLYSTFFAHVFTYHNREKNDAAVAIWFQRPHFAALRRLQESESLATTCGLIVTIDAAPCRRCRNNDRTKRTTGSGRSFQASARAPPWPAP